MNMISSLQVVETLKYLTNNETSLRNSMHVIDVWQNRQYDMRFGKPVSACPTCQTQQYPALKALAKDEEVVLCGRNTVQIHHVSKLDLGEWEQRLKKVATVQRTPFLLRAKPNDEIDFVIFPDGRVLVQGTENVYFGQDGIRPLYWFLI
ncbi:hypothetical protein P5G51_009360 [Virgibacillus sp. 179-BFC.A HS]|uniref:Uncharacterized protein n=1 Tax=Tigheibacillus jepli TaxID=3035914 RepID=A0ABU5CGW4_9BACI|nr:hypothetical protein [Virgibacillus sp. 179-BFC.A HS]MDY0405574.1 hypothetical protein [Virgibacillus sp. 179-BFC.A HS]